MSREYAAGSLAGCEPGIQRTKSINDKSKLLPIQSTLLKPFDSDDVKYEEDEEVRVLDERSDFRYFEPGLHVNESRNLQRRSTLPVMIEKRRFVRVVQLDGFLLVVLCRIFSDRLPARVRLTSEIRAWVFNEE